MNRAESANLNSRRSLRPIVFGLPVLLVAACGADGGDWVEWIERLAGRLVGEALAWYGRTPAPERVAWGGLAGAALLGLGVMLQAAGRLRRSRVIPSVFVSRFLKRLGEGQLDRGKGLDYCELNPSPAARVALAALQRWGRPLAEQERAASLALRREGDALRRGIGTLRRVAALSPLLGFFGTLAAAGRILRTGLPVEQVPPALADALGPLTAGVALAILALVAYDGLAARAESLAGELDRIAAEAIDAIAAREPAAAGRTERIASVRAPHAAFVAPARPARDEP